MSNDSKEICSFEDFNINFLIRENKLGRNVILDTKEIAKIKRNTIIAKYLNALDKSEPIIVITNLSNRADYCDLIVKGTDLKIKILSEINQKGEISYKNGTVVICTSPYVIKNHELFEKSTFTKIVDVGFNPNDKKLFELFQETEKTTFVDINVGKNDMKTLRNIAKCMNKEQYLAINENVNERIAIETIIESHTYKIPAVRDPLMEIAIRCPLTNEQNEEIKKIMNEKYNENEEMNKAQISKTFKSVKKVLDSFLVVGEKSGNGKYDVLENLLDFLLQKEQKVLILTSNSQYALEDKLSDRGFPAFNIRDANKDSRLSVFVGQVVDETKISELKIHSIIFYDVLINHDALIKNMQDTSILIHQNIDAYRLISENTIESIMYNARNLPVDKDKSVIDQINEFLKISKAFIEHPESSHTDIDIKSYLDCSKYEYFFPTFEEDGDKLKFQRGKAERARAFKEVYEQNVITKHIRYSSALVPTDDFTSSKERCINEETDILIARARVTRPHIFELPVRMSVGPHDMYGLTSQMKTIREILHNNIRPYARHTTEPPPVTVDNKTPKKKEKKEQGRTRRYVCIGHCSIY